MQRQPDEMPIYIHMTTAVGGSGSERSRFEAHGLKRYYQTLRERAWLVILCVVIAVGATAIYVATATRTYTADAQMLVAPIPADDSTLIALPVLHSSGDPTRDVLTASSLITTPQVAAAAARELGPPETASSLLSKVTATPVGQSQLVNVQATSTSAKQAQQIANTFIKQVVVTRSAALRRAIATVIPGLRLQLAKLPPSERNGPGTLGDELSQLQQLAAGSDPTISIAAPAPLPSGPTSPRVKLSLIAGLLAGLIIGVGAAFAYSALDPRLRREEQLRELFRIPILAMIPREQSKRLPRPMLPEELSFGALEGFRTLRTMLTSRAGNKPRAFLLTGSSPAEGKTTSSIGLAASLAQGGARVILIEADLRRPTISGALGLKVEYGTEDVLIGEVELTDALVPAHFDGSLLRVLAVKHAGADLADRLSVSVARRLVADALGLADFVVIDSPPLTDVSDALPLARAADEVLIVARIGTSRLSKLSALHDLLIDQGAYPAGIILVGDTATGPGYYYGPTESEASRRRVSALRGRGDRPPDDRGRAPDEGPEPSELDEEPVRTPPQ